MVVPKGKKCFRCGETKPLELFYAHKQTPDGRRPECKKCTRDRESEIKYGMSLTAALERFGEVCMICGTGENLRVDHCHDTLDVRGILCNNCNVGVGYLADDPERMEAAAAYIRQSRA